MDAGPTPSAPLTSALPPKLPPPQSSSTGAAGHEPLGTSGAVPLQIWHEGKELRPCLGISHSRDPSAVSLTRVGSACRAAVPCSRRGADTTATTMRGEQADTHLR